MKRLFCFGLILLMTSCTTVNTYRIPKSDGSFEEVKKEEYCWWKTLLFIPVAIPVGALLIAAAATDTQRAVVNNPNYQAGGSAYRDFSQPQNQPQPQPTYQQQQINNGNGAGRYGNYPIY